MPDRELRASSWKVPVLALLVTLAAPSGSTLAQKKIEGGNASGPVNEYHPVLLFLGQSGVVLGGSRKGRWIDLKALPMKKLGKLTRDDRLGAQAVQTKLVRGDELFSLYSRSGLWDRVRAKGRPVFWTIPSSGDDCLQVDLLPTAKPKPALPVIGVHGSWDAMPRRPRSLGKGSFALDLDGDGVEETIRRVDRHVTVEEDGKPFKKLLSQLELVKNKKVLAIYRFEQTPFYTENYTWFAIDLDGDGDLEIVTQDEGHNSFTRVHDQKSGGAWRSVLSFYSGD